MDTDGHGWEERGLSSVFIRVHRWLEFGCACAALGSSVVLVPGALRAWHLRERSTMLSSVSENIRSKKRDADSPAGPVASLEDLGRDSQPAPEETRQWFKSLEYVVGSILSQHGSAQARFFVNRLTERLRQAGIQVPTTTTTPYLNTISVSRQPAYPV